MDGSNSATPGTKAIRVRRPISAIQNGVTPLKIVFTDTSFNTPFRTHIDNIIRSFNYIKVMFNDNYSIS